MRQTSRFSAFLALASLLQVTAAQAATDRVKLTPPGSVRSTESAAHDASAVEKKAAPQDAQRDQDRAYQALAINKDLVHVEFIHGRPQLSRSLGITPLGYFGQNATSLLHGTAEAEAEARAYHKLRVGSVVLGWGATAAYIADLGYLLSIAGRTYVTGREAAVFWSLLGGGVVMSIVRGALENAGMRHLGRAVALENESVVNRVLGVEVRPSLSVAPLQGGAMAVAGLHW